MLSGVGPKDELERHGIPVVADLPGVGENLQDHPDVVVSYKTNSLDALGVSVRGAIKTLRDIRQYRNARTGTLTTNFAEGGAFLKTRPDLDRPNVQMHFVVGPSAITAGRCSSDTVFPVTCACCGRKAVGRSSCEAPIRSMYR